MKTAEAGICFPVLAFTTDRDVWRIENLDFLTTCGPRTLKNDLQLGMEIIDAEFDRWVVRSVRRIGRAEPFLPWLLGALMTGVPQSRIEHELERLPPTSFEAAQIRVCAAIEAHPLFRRIGLIQGSSIADDVVAQVRARTAGKRRILVCLDSNHTHDHVLAELQAYAPLVSVGSYCVVFDTVVEDLPAELSSDRPWDPGNNPKTAVREYLKDHPEFEVDKAIERKLQITVAPDGYLRRCR